MTNRNRGLRDADPIFLWMFGSVLLCFYTIFPIIVFIKRAMMGWPLLTGSAWVIILWGVVGTAIGVWMIYCAIEQREKKLNQEIE